ncbi:hypothetical protein EDD36DRAFT_228686 [Exophiala viscosa]|uniref:Uncharacterized protein n=1 Tax=Exophiala viscosa TaxID=2486360 RepID=A0AAN6DZX2_9EURO|nr:hypothetical protein EDD36DRAFT_228686 [Exophiala viscosa]
MHTARNAEKSYTQNNRASRSSWASFDRDIQHRGVVRRNIVLCDCCPYLILLENGDGYEFVLRTVTTFAAKHGLTLEIVALPAQTLANSIVLDIDITDVRAPSQHLVGALLLPPFPIRRGVLDIVDTTLEVRLFVHGTFVALPAQTLANGIVLDIDVADVRASGQHLVCALLLPPLPIRGGVLDIVDSALKMTSVLVLVRHGSMGGPAATETASVVCVILLISVANVGGLRSRHGAHLSRNQGQDESSC